MGRTTKPLYKNKTYFNLLMAFYRLRFKPTYANKIIDKLPIKRDQPHISKLLIYLHNKKYINIDYKKKNKHNIKTIYSTNRLKDLFEISERYFKFILPNLVRIKEEYNVLELYTHKKEG